MSVAVQIGEVGEAFEEVDEDQYKELVKQRRSENFVEDDGRSSAPASPAPD